MNLFVIEVAGWLLTKVGEKIADRTIDYGLKKFGLFDATCLQCKNTMTKVPIPEGQKHSLSCIKCYHTGNIYIKSLDTLIISEVVQAQIVIDTAQIVVNDVIVSGNSKKPIQKTPSLNNPDPQIPKIYLTHLAKRTAKKSKKGKTYYRIKVQLRADNPDIIKKVSKVVYYLHSTFRKPVREISKRENNFELSTLAWGMFNLRADVYFQGGQKLSLARYIDFKSATFM